MAGGQGDLPRPTAYLWYPTSPCQPNLTSHHLQPSPSLYLYHQPPPVLHCPTPFHLVHAQRFFSHRLLSFLYNYCVLPLVNSEPLYPTPHHLSRSASSGCPSQPQVAEAPVARRLTKKERPERSFLNLGRAAAKSAENFQLAVVRSGTGEFAPSL